MHVSIIRNFVQNDSKSFETKMSISETSSSNWRSLLILRTFTDLAEMNRQVFLRKRAAGNGSQDETET